MKFNNINELDAQIEKTVKRIVKYYYTDWKNYDRPKYMAFKGSKKREDKRLILSLRDCGTYIYRESDKDDKQSTARTLWDYYHTQSGTAFYIIDLDKLTFTKTK